MFQTACEMGYRNEVSRLKALCRNEGYKILGWHMRWENVHDRNNWLVRYWLINMDRAWQIHRVRNFLSCGRKKFQDGNSQQLWSMRRDCIRMGVSQEEEEEEEEEEEGGVCNSCSLQLNVHYDNRLYKQRRLCMGVFSDSRAKCGFLNRYPSIEES